MSRSRFSSFFVFLVTLAGFTSGAPASAAGVTLYVSPSGSDTNTCLQALPCREIRRALELVGPGDTILVADGSYKGFNVDSYAGTAAQPIVIKAQGSNAVVQVTTDRSDNRDTILIRWSSYVVVDGLRAFNATRAGVRVSESQNVTIKNGVFGNNTKWGIFTDFSDDLLIQNNETYGSVVEHGIYASNSGDRPVIRGNRVHDNTGNGIHVNGDISSGGDGVISGALIEKNIIWNNGTSGGSGINMDGVQDSTIRNNILYNNHATGIGMYQINGGDGPRGNLVYHNTVSQASDGRYALMIWNTTGPITVRNNILYHPSSNRGGITFADNTDVGNTNSDYNILDRITPDDGGTIVTLAQWQSQGHEAHSFSSTPTALFVSPAGANYHLLPTSPAIDHGQTVASVAVDFEGDPRPAGTASDIGADETTGGTPAPTLSVTPASLSFGSVNVGSTADLTVTVRNSGGGTLTGSASTAAPFSVVGTSSYSLAANQTAAITVRFSPTSAVASTGALALTGGAGASVALSGTGASVTPVLSVTPASLSFGSVNVGSTADLTVTVRNAGAGTLAGSASTAAPFSVVGTASYSLAANQTAAITVRFSPTSAVASTGALALTGGAGASVALSGTGGSVTPVLSVTPASLSFATIVVGSTADLTVTVRNAGAGTLAGSASTAAPFSVVGAASYSLAANQSAVITVRFSPAGPVAATGTLTLTGGAGGSVALAGTGVPASAGEPVVWMAAGGVAVSANNLTKTAPTDWGNAGAASTKTLAAGDGYVEFTAQETNTYRLLGLSNGDFNWNWDDIDFALYPLGDGTLRVYERGILRGIFGPYASGDKLRIAVTGNVVRYYRNGSLLYTSATVPIYPLLVDASLYNSGATLPGVVISGAWATSNTDPVSWTGVGGAAAAANNLTKTAAVGWGNAGAVSTKFLVRGEGFVEHTVQETNSFRILGLSHGNSSMSWDDIDYALYPMANSTLRVYEKGVLRGSFGPYALGDKLRIAVTGGAVRYYRNATLLYSSPVAPVYPLLVDTALYNTGATLANVVVSRNWLSPNSEPVVWASAGGVAVAANTLTKTAALGWGNAGAVSSKSLLAGDGYVEHTIQETNSFRIIGLSNGNSSMSWDDIDFGFYPMASGTLRIYEKGAFRGAFGVYRTGDKLRIAVVGGVVRYYRNWILLYESPMAPVYPLLVDTALYTPGATLGEVMISRTFR